MFPSNYTQTPDYSNIVPGILQNYKNNSDLQNTLYGQAKNTVTQPLDFSGLPQIPSTADQAGRDQMTNAVYDQQTRFLDPQFQQGQSDLTSQLANQGIMEGSDAYNRAVNNFNLQKTAAYGDARDRAIQQGGAEQTRLDQLALQNRNQGINEQLAQRNFPLTSLQALNGIGNSETNNLFNAANGSYNANVANQSANNAQSSNFNGGLFTIGSSLLQNPQFTNWASSFF